MAAVSPRPRAGLPSFSWGWGGLIAAACVLCLMAVALAGLWRAGGGGFDAGFVGGAYIRRLVVFSALQAGLSAVISLLVGAPLALALARRRTFPGRSLVLGLLGAATVLPGVVVVFGVVAVYGRSGLVGSGLRALGVEPGGWLYGLPGILIAHVLLNAPFCARVYLRALEGQPPEAYRLATHLGLTPWAVLRCLDLPVLRRETPALAGLVFLLCFTSFATVLALGGGPDRSTLEVAIYEALRVDADFARAASLSALQILFGAAIATAYALALRATRDAATPGRPEPRPDLASRVLRRLDVAVLTLCGVFLAPPMLAVVSGAGALGSLLEADVLAATGTSLRLAASAALLATGLALLMALATSRSPRGRTGRGASLARGLVALAAFAPLAMPPFTLVAGLFVVLRPFADPATLGGPMVVLVNAMMALPFCVRLVEPSLRRAEERLGRTADMLGVGGLGRLRIVHGPALAGPLLASLAMSASLSLGDLGVIAFFGGPDLETLPLLLYQRLGSYRLDEAGAVALLLSALVLALALLAQKGGQDRAELA